MNLTDLKATPGSVKPLLLDMFITDNLAGPETKRSSMLFTMSRVYATFPSFGDFNIFYKSFIEVVFSH